MCILFCLLGVNGAGGAVPAAELRGDGLRGGVAALRPRRAHQLRCRRVCLDIPVRTTSCE
jgi:hypothetical protein